MTLKRLAALVLALVAGASFLQTENWPQFREPTHQGMSSEQNVPLHWNSTSNVFWKSAIPGEDWSSPIVWSDRMSVTMAAENGQSCRVLALDAASGKIIWNKEVFQQVPRRKEGRIYFVEDNGETTVAAAEPEFKVLAKNPLGQHVQASPAISRGRIVIRTDSNRFCIGAP